MSGSELVSSASLLPLQRYFVLRLFSGIHVEKPGMTFKADFYTCPLKTMSRRLVFPSVFSTSIQQNQVYIPLAVKRTMRQYKQDQRTLEVISPPDESLTFLRVLR